MRTFVLITTALYFVGSCHTDVYRTQPDIHLDHAARMDEMRAAWDSDVPE